MQRSRILQSQYTKPNLTPPINEIPLAIGATLQHD